ncbi:Qat anti-phage system QueC-like protein QatC [Planococcus sp. 107-1]|uniref:Qat anti-phage system QueC-like protein QatC n=1 Tax=Planococcus sp. 107-1 TaxID=2908840 RepID=UPI001F4156CD|nr:Qat anti-phage system QueC-like protein QatC [Planococcus sp. 107-1]UJF27925.1 hypothetical protein L0M13_05880 [Planococcus sp. 107-1]
MEFKIQVTSSENQRNGIKDVKITNDKLSNEVELDINFTKLLKFNNTVSPVLKDFLFFSAIIYSIDKSISRRKFKDNWTRDLNVEIPLINFEIYNSVKMEIENAVSFLTGDNWSFNFIELEEDVFIEVKGIELDSSYPKHTSLFSGGLDSLIGVINWLEENQGESLALVGHYDRHITQPKTDQDLLFDLIKQEYGNRIDLVQVRVGQFHGGEETSLRSRSLLFIALGLFVSNSVSKTGSLMIPENGVIALNVPLTPSRRGSCSTRTAHPFFLLSIQDILIKLNVENKLENPLRFNTKGEAVANCVNQRLLNECIQYSVSCGKRGHTATWQNRTAKGCGRCVPCIYRRAALHTINADNELYGVDICSDRIDIDSHGESEQDLRAFLSFLRKKYTADDISKILLSNGKIAFDELFVYSKMVHRAMEELKILLKDKGNQKINEKSGIF